MFFLGALNFKKEILKKEKFFMIILENLFQKFPIQKNLKVKIFQILLVFIIKN